MADLPTTQPKQSLFQKPWVRSLSGIILAAILLVSAITWKLISSSVAIDTSVVSAPVIAISPQSSGILQAVYVNPGDTVTAGENVAQIGTEVLTSRINGVVISTQDVPGQVFSPGSSVVSMIDPSALRVVATVDENKGLSKVHIGDPVSFTVDAFGSQQFVGVVDEISPTSNDTSVVFDISDKRETRTFDIKIRFDTAQYPQLHNGMSAKVWIYPRS